MEIERKFLINDLPFRPEDYPCRHLSQGYVSVNPVIRIRRCETAETAVSYELTCKGRGLMKREEVNLPLEREAYERLKAKVDGRVIVKTRYLIPLEGDLTCELDVFEGDLAPLMLAEVEFSSEEQARAFRPPTWMDREVTDDPSYQNVNMSLNGMP